MRSILLLLAVVGSTEAILVPSPRLQTVHTVTLKGDSTNGRYRFEPDQVSASPGDILLFTAGSGHPHSIAFRVEGLSEQAHAALNDAMPDRVGDLRGPLLTPGHAEYRVTVPALKPGKYYFYCLVHLSYKEQGQLIVLAPKGKK